MIHQATFEKYLASLTLFAEVCFAAVIPCVGVDSSASDEDSDDEAAEMGEEAMLLENNSSGDSMVE